MTLRNKIHLSVIITLVSLVLWMPSSASSAVMTAAYGQMIPDPQNPYCGYHQFTPPEVECPPGNYYVDFWCQADCAAEYQSTMAVMYAGACDAWRAADSQYFLDSTAAIDTYNSCVLSAQDQAALDACRYQFLASIASNVNTLTAIRSAIDATVAAQKAGADADYQECASECCILVK